MPKYLTNTFLQLSDYKFFLKFAINLLIILISHDNTAAQSTETDTKSIINQQIWIDLYPHYYISEKLEYYGDAGYRSIVNNKSWSRIYARPSFKHHFNKTFEVHAGIGLFYIFYNNSADQFEVRPWQGFQVNWPKITRISFKHLVKLEERFSFKTEDWSSGFEFRFRYKFFGKVSFVRNEKIFIPFYAELFLPLTGEIEELYSNKGRAGVGLGYKLGNDWQFAFVFNWQGSRVGVGENINVSDYAYQIKIKKIWNGSLLKKNS